MSKSAMEVVARSSHVLLAAVPSHPTVRTYMLCRNADTQVCACEGWTVCESIIDDWLVTAGQ